MIIIPDETKAQPMLDSHPDIPEHEEYYDVNVIDTIKLDFEEFLQWCFDERLVGTWGDTNIRDVPEIIEQFIKSKLQRNK